MNNRTVDAHSLVDPSSCPVLDIMSPLILATCSRACISIKTQGWASNAHSDINGAGETDSRHLLVLTIVVGHCSKFDPMLSFVESHGALVFVQSKEDQSDICLLAPGLDSMKQLYRGATTGVSWVNKQPSKDSNTRLVGIGHSPQGNRYIAVVRSADGDVANNSVFVDSDPSLLYKAFAQKVRGVVSPLHWISSRVVDTLQDFHAGTQIIIRTDPDRDHGPAVNAAFRVRGSLNEAVSEISLVQFYPPFVSLLICNGLVQDDCVGVLMEPSCSWCDLFKPDREGATD